MAKAIGQFTISDLNDGANAVQALLTNESCTIAANSSGVPSSYTGCSTQLLVYDGATDVTSQYTITKSDPTGVTTSISGNTISVTNVSNGIGGSVTITATKGSKQLTKVFSVAISKAGTDGAAGANAKIVDITPSSIIFKSTTGPNGTFNPQYIYLYPIFQNVTYTKWQYSTNGGSSWNEVTSGQHSLTIATYSSKANSLRIERNSDLYTDSITSISFKCVSSDSNIFDVVTVAKLYDATGINSAKIIASSSSFLNSGDEISPNDITLTPKLSNVTFSKWQHSIDSGTNWVDTTAAIATIDSTTHVLTLNKDSQIFDSSRHPAFKLVTSDANIYDIITIDLLIDRGTADTTGLATDEDIDNKTSKVFLIQPTPPYKVGDVWIVQDGPDKGKFKTCAITRKTGSYSEDDWITPLTAYTTVTEFQNIVGASPDTWEQGKKSITQRVNESTKEVESVETEMSKLSVRTSNIEMSFSKTGTSNFLRNSSGQYGTRYWTGTTSSSASLSTVTATDAGDVRKQIVAGYAFKVGVTNWSSLSSYVLTSDSFIPPAGNEFSVSLKIKNGMKYSKVHVAIKGYATISNTLTALDGYLGEFDAYYEDSQEFVLHRKMGISKKGTKSSVEYDVEQIVCIITISITDKQTVSGSLPAYNEKNTDGSYKYAGKLISINSGSTYSYCNTHMTDISITKSDIAPSQVEDNEVWKCTKTIFNESTGLIQYLNEVYYQGVNSSIEPITDSYEIAQLDASTDDIKYKKQLPVTYETAASISKPNTGTIYIADIMFNGGNKIMTWTPRQDEVLYGSRIKFSSAGIEISSEAGFKRILDEQTDVAYRIDTNGTILGIIWKLSENGMYVKNIYCYGSIAMGSVTNELNTDTFKQVLEMKRSDSNDGVDEYIYS